MIMNYKKIFKLKENKIYKYLIIKNYFTFIIFN